MWDFLPQVSLAGEGNYVLYCFISGKKMFWAGLALNLKRCKRCKSKISFMHVIKEVLELISCYCGVNKHIEFFSYILLLKLFLLKVSVFHHINMLLPLQNLWDFGTRGHFHPVEFSMHG